ncbi:hypothetical protein A3F08_00785 [Candidatus Berkelbacteria bacterium RIFCSPHIGHO2_12_FULL_36_9]|uniref:HTH arsR-type domain-containing protein n=1 Tax=Candidatus Berkelbacteria bacterium RIFCSPHIGHO2_12_FULL_36_9 TaxID=1797469 RepID=A0A1F5EJQ1_9BACT|nr:MAG: hypothetical protein A3F08_00785 [Candidatus Berkelbacteria bacterium RIFCSPHIGHO2_12_FULL_36_9]
MKNKRELEKIFKGVANHRRVEILLLLEKTPGLSVIEISYQLKVDYKTIAEHIRKLHIAGLIFKTNKGSSVANTISPLGQSILVFCRTLE